MTDIVDRLRDYAGICSDGFAGLAVEAADEIERLRAENESLLRIYRSVRDDIRAATIEECAQLVEDVGYSREDAVTAIRNLAKER